MPSHGPRFMAAIVSLALFFSASPAIAEEAQIQVGFGQADITGKPAENPMMGYGDSTQVSTGIHTRQFARAYAFEDAEGDRAVFVATDLLSATNLSRERIKERLASTHPGALEDADLMIAATHTHSGPGGYSDNPLYNMTTLGVHEQTLDAIVDGIAAAVGEALDSIAPVDVQVGLASKTGAGVNRSRSGWEANQDWIKGLSPEGLHPTSTSLLMKRNGAEVGMINWFPTHATSLPTENTLISSDNKGVAQQFWEARRGPMSSFVYADGADVTPNTRLHPGKGPSDDPFESVVIIGERVYEAAVEAAEHSTPMGSADVNNAIVWLDMENQVVRPEFSTTGREERTCTAILGAPFGAGSTEDGGGGVSFLHEGVDNNHIFDAYSDLTYAIAPQQRACHAPKAKLIPVGLAKAIQTVLPVQLFKIGDLWIAGLPGEVTTGSGIMMREAIAKAVGTTPEHIVISSASNTYGHYLTTPQEYDQQNYEAGATAFGRYTTPALTQGLDALARHMTEGTPLEAGSPPPLRTYVPAIKGNVAYDSPGSHAYGDVLQEPDELHHPGTTATAVFQGAHPNNNIRHGDTYMAVERLEEDGWHRVANDHHYSTRFSWQRHLAAQSLITTTWDIPDDAAPGTYRFIYYGTARAVGGELSEFTGTSRPFQVL